MNPDLDFNTLSDFDLLSTRELNHLIDSATNETWLEGLDAYDDEEQRTRPVRKPRRSDETPPRRRPA